MGSTTVNDQAAFESPFPTSPRVHFRVNPIQFVLAQFSFPTILRIGAELPVEYQERIRHQYPLYRVREATRLPDQLQFIQPALPPEFQVRLYDFASEDGIWTVTIAQDFITLQTSRYTRWEEFRERFQSILDAFVQVYEPSFFLRIGLRYHDLLDRRRLGLEGEPWMNLLNSPMAGELSDQDVSSGVEERVSRFVIRLGQSDGHVTVNHGTQFAQAEELYFIDADFYREATMTLPESQLALERLKRHAGRFFRWCISSKLREAMQPEELEGS